MNAWVFLSVAILAEVAATLAMKASDGFTKLGPSSIVVVGYLIAFYCLSLTLKSIPVGIAYSVWAGVGIVLVSLAGTWLFKQRLDAAAIVGISMIIIGVLVIHLFSKSSS